MKYIRPAFLAILLCFVTGVAFADDIKVQFDPQSPIPDGTYGIITSSTAVYSVNWESCSSTGPLQVFGPGYSDDNSGCIALINLTGGAITQLSLSFVVNSALVGQTLGCDSIDEYLTSNTCSGTPGAFTLGETVSFQFFAGQPIPNTDSFYFLETGVALDNAPTVSLTAPEPTSLTLLAAGMGLIGLCMVFVKR
jgi:hypothetical protein